MLTTPLCGSISSSKMTPSPVPSATALITPSRLMNEQS
jgi:hypothetical protein